MARRLVKYLYFDDDTGELIVDLGSKSEKAAVLVNGRLASVHSAHFQKVGSPLPAPGPRWEGIIVTHGHPGTKEQAGDKTEVLVCLQNSEGEFEWIELGEST